MHRGLQSVALCGFLLIVDVVVCTVVRGSVNLNAVTYTQTDIVDPIAVVIAGSSLGVTTVSGSVAGSSIVFLSCSFANLTFSSLVNTSRITLTKCTIGDQFTDANLPTAQDWLYASPTTAWYFSSPVLATSIAVSDSFIYGSARGLHFASTVKDSVLSVKGCTFKSSCLNITDEVLTAAPATCANVFALSSDYIIGNTRITVNSTKITTESDFGGANALYFVSLGQSTEVALTNCTFKTSADDERCYSSAPVSSVATCVRLLSSASAVVTIKGSQLLATSNTTCNAYGGIVGTLAKGSWDVYNSSITSVTSATTSTSSSAVSFGSISSGAVSIAQSGVTCWDSPNCIAVSFGAVTSASVTVRQNYNVTSTGNCFSFASAVTSVLLFDTNTMFCSVLFVKTPPSWGPFVAPTSYFVGRCNTASGTEVVAATLPALVPAQMVTVGCTACQIALDCNAPATSLVLGTAGACRCTCKQAYLDTVVFHRRAIDTRCSFVSVTRSKSRSAATETLSRSRNVTLSRSKSSSRDTWSKSSSTEGTFTNTVSASQLVTKTPSRTKTKRLSVSKTTSQTVIYVAPPSVVLAQSITNRVPDALVYSAVAASVLAGLFSPTLANKASTITRILFSIDCFESSDRYKPVFFLDVFTVGSDVTKRLLGASVFASTIAAASLALAHTVYALSTGPTDLALGRRLAGHFFAFCFTLFVPFAAEYASTSLSHSNSGRAIAIVMLLLVLSVCGFALYYVAIRFPRRRSRPRTLAMRKFKEIKALRVKAGQLLPEQGGDPIELPFNVPYIDERTTLNVEQDSEEDRVNEARWARAVEEDDKRELSRHRNRGTDNDPKAEEKEEATRKRRRLRHRKRQRHWSVWHTNRFTSTLYGVFFEARDYRFAKIRLYFFEDWLWAVLVALVSGVLPGSRGCGAITILNALLCGVHAAYLFTVRPFRQFVSAALSLLLATGMVALAVSCYFATTSSDLIDVSVQIAVVLTGVLVAHVTLVGVSAIVRFFRRATSNDEKIASDEDSEEIEARRAATELQRLSLAKLLSGADGDAQSGLLHLERVATQTREEAFAGDLLFHGNEGRFGRGLVPGPPDDTTETDGDIDEDRENRHRRIRMQYPHYVERPLCSHEDSVARFLEVLKSSKPRAPSEDAPLNTMHNPNAQKKMIGGHLGFVSSRPPLRREQSAEQEFAPLISPLTFLQDESPRRARPKPITDDDIDQLRALQEHVVTSSSSDDASSDDKLSSAKRKTREKRKLRNNKSSTESKPSGFTSIFHSPKKNGNKPGDIQPHVKKVSDTLKKAPDAASMNPIDAAVKSYKPPERSRYTAVSTRPHSALLDGDVL